MRRSPACRLPGRASACPSATIAVLGPVPGTPNRIAGIAPPVWDHCMNRNQEHCPRRRVHREDEWHHRDDRDFAAEARHHAEEEAYWRREDTRGQ